MSIILTKTGFSKIRDELSHLVTVDRPAISLRIEETRPIGVVEDNPEYLQAINAQMVIENRITTLSDILGEAMVFEKTMCKEDTVAFGTTVHFVNYDTEEEKRYTLVSIYESDVAKGLISCESPFARAMIGLHSGDTFDFNDVEYEILNIDYLPLVFE